MEKIFNVRTVEPETFVCDCEKKLDKEESEPDQPSDFELLHDSDSADSSLPFTGTFEDAAKVSCMDFCGSGSFRLFYQIIWRKTTSIQLPKMMQRFSQRSFERRRFQQAAEISVILLGRSWLDVVKNVSCLKRTSSRIDLSFLRPRTFSMLPALKSAICLDLTRIRDDLKDSLLKQCLF